MTENMKDSGIEWIGEIPEKWELFKVKHLFVIGRGRVISELELNDNGLYPVYSSQTKNDGCMGYLDTYDFDVEQLTWTTDGVYAGTVFIRSGKYSCTNVCGTLLPQNIKKNNLKFMKYSLEFIATYHKRPDTNGAKIMNNEMGEIKITIPPFPEQQAIADFLDKKVGQVDDILADLNRQVEILNQYKKSLVTETVTKGLNPNAEMKDSGIDWIGDIPNEWNVKKVKYTSKLNRGIFGHRPRNDPDYYDGDYPFIQTGDVANAKQYITSYSQTLNELGKSVSKEFPKGTIAITLAANVGDVAILDFSAYFPDSVMAIIPNENYLSKYVYYILSVMKEEFLKTAVISTQLNLNVERVGNVYMPITFNIEEQKEIADYLDKKCSRIDSLMEDKKKQIEKIENYKKSLIYEYVTGKKRVKGV